GGGDALDRIAGRGQGADQLRRGLERQGAGDGVRQRQDALLQRLDRDQHLVPHAVRQAVQEQRLSDDLLDTVHHVEVGRVNAVEQPQQLGLEVFDLVADVVERGGELLREVTGGIQQFMHRFAKDRDWLVEQLEVAVANQIDSTGGQLQDRVEREVLER